jgi:hypothetical protein
MTGNYGVVKYYSGELVRVTPYPPFLTLTAEDPPWYVSTNFIKILPLADTSFDTNPEQQREILGNKPDGY